MPYMPPKVHFPSAFELVPYGIQEDMYRYHGVSSKVELETPREHGAFRDRPVGRPTSSPRISPAKLQSFKHADGVYSPFVTTGQHSEQSMLYLNRGVCAEALNIMFRKVDVVFDHHLSAKEDFYCNSARYIDV